MTIVVLMMIVDDGDDNNDVSQPDDWHPGIHH